MCQQLCRSVGRRDRDSVRQQLVEGRYHDGTPNAEIAFSPSAALLRAIALNATVVAQTDTAIPSFTRGWGELDASAAFGQIFPRLLIDVRNSEGMVTADTCRMHLTLEKVGRLAVTLTWTEPPGSVGADNSVVNNLDLRMTSPKGELLLGNNFSNGVSISGGVADSVNSTEMIVLADASAGDWAIEVIANQVNVGRPGQGFALVATGPISSDSTPVVDRSYVVRVSQPVGSDE